MIQHWPDSLVRTRRKVLTGNEGPEDVGYILKPYEVGRYVVYVQEKPAHQQHWYYTDGKEAQCHFEIQVDTHQQTQTLGDIRYLLYVVKKGKKAAMDINRLLTMITKPMKVKKALADVFSPTILII